MAKLQDYRAQFENVKMNEDEDVASFFLRDAKVVNNMKALGETIKECIIVKKILRYLPSRFNPKASAIEESRNWETFTMNQLLGSLMAYEMRLPKGKSNVREESVKVDKCR